MGQTGLPRLLLFQPFFDPVGCEGDEGGCEDPDWGGVIEGGFDAPFLGDHGIEEGDAEDAEEDAVDHADDADCHGLVPDVFEWHGDEEEDEVGDGLGDADDAQSVNSIAEHGAER